MKFLKRLVGIVLALVGVILFFVSLSNTGGTGGMIFSIVLIVLGLATAFFPNIMKRDIEQ